MIREIFFGKSLFLRKIVKKLYFFVQKICLFLKNIVLLQANFRTSHEIRFYISLIARRLSERVGFADLRVGEREQIADAEPTNHEIRCRI